MTWQDGLSGPSLQIAATTESPLRVMAGPGTGKSFAMKRRVARLLEEGTDPKRILPVTFTRNAAAGLLTDLHALGIDGCDQLRAGTLHSFCFWLLSQQHVFQYLGRVARPVITFNAAGVLQFEGNVLLADVSSAGNFGAKRDCTKRIRAFEAAWARLQSQVPGWPPSAIDAAFHAEVIRWLKFHRGLLIGELVPEAYRFLRNNPAAAVLKAFDHVIVDEYQDLNRAEQELIDLLASNGAAAIVGDVNQSIYRFRHANPEGITGYATVHPATHDESLIECRRCPLTVVQIADSLIRKNHPPGGPSRLVPKSGNPPGVVRIVQWNSIDDEADGLAVYIANLVENVGFSAGEILVLTPRRLLGYAIRDRLKDLKIPVHSFYHEEALESESAQVALAILTLLADPEDRIALRWWLGHGSPSARVNAYQKLRAHCESTGVSPWEALSAIVEHKLSIPGTQALVDRFNELLNVLSTLVDSDLATIVEVLLPADDEGVETLRDAALVELEVAETVGALAEALKSTISQPELPAEGNYVRVMSLHKSKGLTSKVAIVAGCIQGLIPFQGDEVSINDAEAEMAEQRRLFYVAITRCTERLVLSSFTKIKRQLAYKIGAKLPWGKSAVSNTIASTFWGELGSHAPQPQAGSDWLEKGFL